MAKQSGNVVTHGLRGKIGDLLVFRQRDGRTIVSKVPVVSNRTSEAQRAQRRKFQRAVLYGKSVLATPEMLEVYAPAAAKKGRIPFNVAVADFLHAPDIELIDLSGYHGMPGDVIRVEAMDDFAVKEVKVVITNADGSLVEEGFATPGAVGYEWTYHATAENPDLAGDRIEVFASDMPGNITAKTEEL
ncbi:MAG: hypothetical protein LBT83_05320 [Tannerella sp.]|jgi:hypothetical protein|nr:hypothetical protein [Tannerella sp.]